MKTIINRTPLLFILSGRLRKTSLIMHLKVFERRINNFFSKKRREKKGFFYPEEEIKYLKEEDNNRNRISGSYY